MSPVFFTDRDLGKRFPEILAAAGLAVERHEDLFPADCPDEVWLEHVGKQGLVAITHDARIRYKPNELAAVKRHRVALLVVSGKSPFHVLAHRFVLTHAGIVEFMQRQPRPFIAKVHGPSPSELKGNPRAPGSVSLWYPR